MVKMLLCFLFLMASAGNAGAWGILNEVRRDEDFGVDRMVDNVPIRYVISPGITPQEEKILIDNLHTWPAETLRQIRQNHREKEFADIIPLLQRNVRTMKVDRSTPYDIFFSFDPALPSRGVYRHKTHEIFVRTDLRSYFRKISLHEIGHYYGMADQYESARVHANTNHSSDPNNEAGSIMNSFEQTDSMTCDDVDGFINLIDFRLAQRQGHFSERALRGWTSFCPNSKNLYRQAYTVNRNPHDTIQLDSLLAKENTFDEGKAIQQQWVTRTQEDLLSLFLIGQGDAVLRDPQNNYIHKVLSSHGVPLCPLAKNGKKTLRKFFYEQTKENVYNIYIQCYQDHVFRHEYVLPVGGKFPWTIHWAASSPKTHGFSPEDYSLSARFTNEAIDNVQIIGTHTLPDGSSIHIRWTHSFANNDSRVEWDNGQTMVYPTLQRHFATLSVQEALTSENMNLLLKTKQVYDSQIPAIRSFYEHFYLPLFPTQKERLRRAIKEALSNS